MKLYNIYQNIILEEIFNKVQLTEAVPVEFIDKLLAGEPRGKYYHVSFNYTDKKGNVSNRYVKIHQRNISTIGNNLIDAYQVSRDGQTSGLNPRTGKIENFGGWKKFNLAKMSDFKVSKVPFYQPNFGFNRTGNNSPTVASTPTIAPFDYQYAQSTEKKAEKRQQALFPKAGIQPTQGPSQRPKTAEPATAKQPVRPMRRVEPKPIEPTVEPTIEPEEEIENNLELKK
jgi:hypothetical protein